MGTLAAELHAGLARLSRSLNTLHAALGTDNASMEDGPLLRQALVELKDVLAFSSPKGYSGGYSRLF